MKPNIKYKNTYEYWHKGTLSSIVFQIQTTGKECHRCKSHDLDIIGFSCSSPTYGEIAVSYFCRDCDAIEKINYPIISRKKTEKIDSTKDKIDDMLENDLTFLKSIV